MFQTTFKIKLGLAGEGVAVSPFMYFVADFLSFRLPVRGAGPGKKVFLGACADSRRPWLYMGEVKILGGRQNPTPLPPCIKEHSLKNCFVKKFAFVESFDLPVVDRFNLNIA